MDVSLPLDQLTDRQLTLFHISLLDEQVQTLRRLDYFMSDLASSVASLQAAVDTMAVRFNAQNQVLTDALANATQQLEALQIDDDAAKQSLADALAAASAAAEEIDSNVAELNSIGAEPSTPVENVPVEELPEAPADTSSTPTEDTSGV